jgi:hypothetical protein
MTTNIVCPNMPLQNVFDYSKLEERRKKLQLIIKNYKVAIGPSSAKGINYQSFLTKKLAKKSKTTDKILKELAPLTRVDMPPRFEEMVEYELELINIKAGSEKSEKMGNIMDYSFIDKIPQPHVPCKFVKNNCGKFNDGDGPTDVVCCDNGILTALRCNVDPTKVTKKVKDYKGRPVPDGCLSDKHFDIYKDLLTAHPTKDAYQAAWAAAIKSSTNEYKGKSTTYMNDFYKCPVYDNDKQRYCNNVYNFGVKYDGNDSFDKDGNLMPKQLKTFRKQDLSRAVYDNIKSTANYTKLLTDPKINVGSNYLITTHKCLDNNGKEKMVQTKIKSGSNRGQVYKKLDSAIKKAVIKTSTTRDFKVEDRTISFATLKDLIKIENNKIYKFLVGSQTITVTMNGEIRYYAELILKGGNSGLVYSLFDDIKDTNPVALLNRFLAQSENVTMKCSDIADKTFSYPLKQYVVKYDGTHDKNSNINLETKQENPINLLGCYIAKEGFSFNNGYIVEFILLTAFILIFLKYY